MWDREYLFPSFIGLERLLNIIAASPSVTEGSPASTQDDLGPFATLTTDEDRERKAETASPGTYNVIVNPDSFQHLPEYTDEIEKKVVPSLRRGSLAASLASSVGKDSIAPVPGDPNLVVLKQFEDTNRRTWKDIRQSSSPTVSKIKLEDDEEIDALQPEISLMQRAAAGGPDLKYLEQFRHVVWKQLISTELEKREDIPLETSSVQVLEHLANHFPPVCVASFLVQVLEWCADLFSFSMP